MSLKLCSIASGSKGNCTLILSDNTAILVDAGACCTRVSKVLSSFGLTLADLSGIVVTHEHSDHVCNLGKLSAYTPVFVHPDTLKNINPRFGNILNVEDVPFFENGFSIGDIKVLPFRIPHDAAYPLGYTFECDLKRVSVATDIGLPTVGVLKNILSSEVVLLEANHDVGMLKDGNYPEWLKRRILGNNGHLSNDAAALLAEKIADRETHDLVLGHLSRENNLPSLAYGAVKARLETKNVGKDMKISLALQDETSEVFSTI